MAVTNVLGPSVAAPRASLIQVDGLGGYLRLGALVVVLALLAAAINRVGRLGHAMADVRAAARATVQLLVVGLLISAVLQSWWLTGGFVLLMLTVASVTAGRRLADGGQWYWAAAPVWAGSVPVGAGLLVSGLIPVTPIAVVPVLGILIGGAMTATTLAGRRTLNRTGFGGGS